ncbi:hypothetical protein R1flu_012426 [Riccia fluitans]|uniref:AB hydrolase-1 domain-containing protein n=1 Tax=Riccia fluitans TaxID=41844 RepID=A0ABD1ZD18_9MARC
MISRVLATFVLLSIPLSSLGIRFDPSDAPVGPDSRVPASDTYVFVHGVAQAAWAWYRIETMFQESGFNTMAIDLTGHGKDKTKADSVTTLSFYAKPLTDYLASSKKKVILVAHGLGGAPASYAMEAYPEKIAKAVFLSAVMPLSGESSLDLLKDKFPALKENCYVVNYNNPANPHPTSVMMNMTNSRYFYYNRSPVQDVTLAEHLLEETPWAVFYDDMKLTDANYGSIHRYFIRTGEDRVIPWDLQQSIIDHNPPQKFFTLKNGDHSAFFSETPWLFKLLKEISYIQD